jgi:hypothetical protein
LPLCEDKKQEPQKPMDVKQMRTAFSQAIDNSQYNWSAPRVDGEIGNKKFCTINLNVHGNNFLGIPTSVNHVAEYTIQLTEEGKYWIEIIKKTQVQ